MIKFRHCTTAAKSAGIGQRNTACTEDLQRARLNLVLLQVMYAATSDEVDGMVATPVR